MEKIDGRTKFGKFLYGDNLHELIGFFNWMIKNGKINDLDFRNGSVVFHSPESADEYSGKIDFTENSNLSDTQLSLFRNAIRQLSQWCDGKSYGKLSYSIDEEFNEVFNIISQPGEFSKRIIFNTVDTLDTLYKEHHDELMV
ncbi:hypothetical protein NC796_07450 [Aliifodinibius sp. S!AR15-10]|uniref:hypothetical protein n=1 Tax=Aliifodinibius sp. S!AR15-10 TaxID=2950437 RepID=UPI0028589630|nr:hypothetical protein [Aliifodinibius sp. S!AR15-10]MDR8390967.1 hypothetical protein [Aliifodinibius sp. S!AR15-10]